MRSSFPRQSTTSTPPPCLTPITQFCPTCNRKITSSNQTPVEEIVTPVGYQFVPSDKQLLGYYLYRKITGTLSPVDEAVVKECDLYGEEEPKEIWERFAVDDEGTDLYLFTKLKKPKQGRSNISRKVGVNGGTWHGVQVGQGIQVNKNLLGNCKEFVFKKPNSGEEKVTWLMKEYSLDINHPNSDYVLCRIRKKVNTKVNNNVEGNSSKKKRRLESPESQSAGLVQSHKRIKSSTCLKIGRHSSRMQETDQSSDGEETESDEEENRFIVEENPSSRRSYKAKLAPEPVMHKVTLGPVVPEPVIKGFGNDHQSSIADNNNMGHKMKTTGKRSSLKVQPCKQSMESSVIPQNPAVEHNEHLQLIKPRKKKIKKQPCFCFHGTKSKNGTQSCCWRCKM